MFLHIHCLSLHHYSLAHLLSALEFLQSEATCFLGTVDEQMQPRVTPVHYFIDPSNAKMYILSNHDTTKVTNIERDERVSVAICDSSKDPLDRTFASCKGLQITGTARIIPSSESDPQDLSGERAIALRFYKWEDAAKEVGLVGPPVQSIIVVTPLKMELLDMSQSFKKRFGADVSPKQVWQACDQTSKVEG